MKNINEDTRNNSFARIEHKMNADTVEFKKKKRRNSDKTRIIILVLSSFAIYLLTVGLSYLIGKYSLYIKIAIAEIVFAFKEMITASLSGCLWLK